MILDTNICRHRLPAAEEVHLHTNSWQVETRQSEIMHDERAVASSNMANSRCQNAASGNISDTLQGRIPSS